VSAISPVVIMGTSTNVYSAVYQGNKLVSNATKLSYLSETPNYANSIVFKTAGYSNTWTAPYITASTLANSDVSWRRLSDGAVTYTKTPSMTFFNKTNDTYWVTCSDWSKVTAFSFTANASTSVPFLNSISTYILTPKLTGLTSLSMWYQSLNFQNQLSPLPESLTTLESSWQFCTGLKEPPSVSNLLKTSSLRQTWRNCTSVINNFPYVNSLTNVDSLGSTWYTCSSGTEFPAVSNLTKTTTMNRTYYGCSANTNEFPYVNSLTNNTDLAFTWYGCFGIRNGFPAVSNMIKVSSLDSTWRNCYGNTNEFPYVNSLTNNTDLAFTWYGCFGIRNGFPAVSNMIKVTSLLNTWYGCYGNTNGFPYVNSLTNVNNLSYTWSSSVPQAGGFPEVSNLTKVANMEATWALCRNNQNFPSVANLTNATSLVLTWQDCGNMTNNIADILQPVSWFSSGKCKNFLYTFLRCNLLQGSAMPYVNAIMSAPGYPTGYTTTQMFYNCTNLTDYASIPANFK